ncbi:hypothetical protein GCM10010428_77950 [Actinosynnema pretiosum subsp. pretiosum]
MSATAPPPDAFRRSSAWPLATGAVAGRLVEGAAVDRTGKPHLVEVDDRGLVWAKSTASGPDPTKTMCVEVALGGERVLVRCSRNRRGERLNFPADAWNTFKAARAAGS